MMFDVKSGDKIPAIEITRAGRGMFSLRFSRRIEENVVDCVFELPQIMNAYLSYDGQMQFAACSRIDMENDSIRRLLHLVIENETRAVVTWLKKNGEIHEEFLFEVIYENNSDHVSYEISPLELIHKSR